MNDREIIKLYFSRAESAVEMTNTKYRNYLIKIALNILQSLQDSEEAVNDTYLALWNCIPPNCPNDLATFSAKILRRICVDRLKKQNAQKRGGGEIVLILDELSECIPSRTNTEDEFMSAELSKSINTFLYTLPDVKRNVFINRYFYAEPVKNIARDFGYSESKVKSILSRTAKQLKEHLHKEGF